jgi:CHAD domain-containing protein
VEGIHQMRVALRRLRGLLNTLKKELPEAAHDWANGQLKRILQSLGPARNWDVFLDEMVGAVAEEGALPNAPAFLRAANIARMRAHLHARDAIASPAHTIAILELLRWFEIRGWRTHGDAGKALNRSIGKCAGALVDRQFRRARKRAKGFGKLSTEDRHAFRIAVKSLRYALDLFCPALEIKKVRALIKTLKPLQEQLGHLNDISTAQGLLRELTDQDASPNVVMQGGLVLGWHEARLHAQEKRLCRAVEKFRAITPFW